MGGSRPQVGRGNTTYKVDRIPPPTTGEANGEEVLTSRRPSERALELHAGAAISPTTIRPP